MSVAKSVRWSFRHFKRQQSTCTPQIKSQTKTVSPSGSTQVEVVSRHVPTTLQRGPADGGFSSYKDHDRITEQLQKMVKAAQRKAAGGGDDGSGDDSNPPRSPPQPALHYPFFLPYLYHALRNSELESAEKIYRHLTRLMTPAQLTLLHDSGLVLMFLKAYADQSDWNLVAVRRWLAFSKPNSSPNYLIVFKAALRHLESRLDEYIADETRVLAQECAEMLAKHSNLNILLTSLELRDEDVRRMTAYLKSLSIPFDESLSLRKFSQEETPVSQSSPPGHDRFSNIPSISTTVKPSGEESLTLKFIRDAVAPLYQSNERNDNLLQISLEQSMVSAAEQLQAAKMQHLHETSGMGNLHSVSGIYAAMVKMVETSIQPDLIKAPALVESIMDESGKTPSQIQAADMCSAAFVAPLGAHNLALIGLNICLREHADLTKLPGVRVLILCRDIARAISTELSVKYMASSKIREKTSLKYMQLNKIILSSRRLDTTKRQVAKQLMEVGEEVPWEPQWDGVTEVTVGAFILRHIVKATQFTEASLLRDNKRSRHLTPVFEHRLVPFESKTVGVVIVHPLIRNALKTESHYSVDPIDRAMLPMVVPPKPWLKIDSGGYLSVKIPFIRSKDGNKRQLQESENVAEKCLMALDVLGQTSWCINEKVFQVVAQAWNEKLTIGDLPVADLAALETWTFPDDFASLPLEQRQALSQKYQELKTNTANQYSMRCDLNYKFEIARSFIGRKIYFPHNLDFRGRAYPLPKYFHHLGNDVTRSLLLFYDRKKLGKEGLRWLKIHLANLVGFNKHNLDDREAFATKHLEEIYDSADRPLDGKRWWLKAEEPWQCLACCMELAAALRSPDPEMYESNLPVHQDGSCNGLQHYAALGRDTDGAKSVNLVPSETPQDVYARVAVIVQNLVREDAAAGDVLALKLQDVISRKVVKTTVMTNVYGVTMAGAREQIDEKLKDALPDIEIKERVKASSYLANKVFAALDRMFSSARALQIWLGEVAEEMCLAVPPQIVEQFPYEEVPETVESNKVKPPRRWPPPDDRPKKESITWPMNPVSWRTPCMDLPIVQPYFQHKTTRIRTMIQSISVTDRDSPGRVDVRKQHVAFPPNFIHSLDATHMMLTAMACYEAGLTFASVHDSYWTHACDVPVMNRLLRQQFVALHKRPILTDLVRDWQLYYKDYRVPCQVTGSKSFYWRRVTFPPLPALGDFDIEQVVDSIYFFS